MAHRRGRRWVASGYDKSLGRKTYLGTFDEEARSPMRRPIIRPQTRPTGRETCNDFASAGRGTIRAPRASTNKHNGERVQRFAQDFKGVRLTAVDRPRARGWAASPSLKRPCCSRDVRRRRSRRARSDQPVLGASPRWQPGAEGHRRAHRGRASGVGRCRTRRPHGARRLWPGVPRAGPVRGVRRASAGRAVRAAARGHLRPTLHDRAQPLAHRRDRSHQDGTLAHRHDPAGRAGRPA